jgi:phycocyanin-associated rod linker protein
MADSKKAEKHQEQEQEHQAVHAAASISGAMGGDRGQVYRLRVQQSVAAKYSRVARYDTTELLVPFDQLSAKFQELHRNGNKLVSVESI